MTSRFRRASGDKVVARLHPEEVSLLRRLPEDLRPVIDVPLGEPATGADPAGAASDVAEAGGDPIRERLFPHAYLDPTEEGSEVEWQRMVHPELVRAKLAALAALATSLERFAPVGDDEAEVVLTPEEVEAWLGAINDARLALGTALGVSEDLIDVPNDDPAAPALAVYAWLTELQGALVEVLLR